VPLAGAYDEVVLLCDSDLEPDYAALQRILEHFGATVRRLALGRVPVDGRISSARHGGWRGHTAGALLHDLGDDDVHTLRLGVRLYFIAMLGPGSAVGFDPALLRRSLRRAARLLAAGSDPDLAPTAVVVVLRHVDLAALIRGCWNFARGLDAAAAAGWRRSFTRAVFLAGSPANLRHRATFAQVAADGSAAWTAPAPDHATAGLRRLLRAYEGPKGLPVAPPFDVRIGPPPGGGSRRDLYLATAGVPVMAAVVDLHHLVAEAVLDGLLGEGDVLRVHTVPRLAGSFEAVRVGVDPFDPLRLHARAALTAPGGRLS
jgi:hypothetical protein